MKRTIIASLAAFLVSSFVFAQGINNPQTNASQLTTGTLPAGRLPAFTGDVTTSAGTAATTLAAGSASALNSGTLAAARGGAGTITGALKGNGAGVVTQAACADLSNAAASCATDATNATNIGSGTLPAARLPLTNATLTTTPTTGNTTTGQMVGTGGVCKLTPVYSGRILIIFSGTVNNGTGAQSIVVTLKFGTGVAPANNAAITGTTVGVATSITSAASSNEQFVVQGIVTGLTPSTAYWIDLAGAAGAGTTVFANMTCSIMEF